MKTIYLFSGLGADYRVFSNLDLSGFQPVHIEWLKPRASESLESYLFRLAEYHQIPKQGALVLGVSFGGLCISELAKYYDFEKMILVSSVKNKFEIPAFIKLARLFSLYKLMPRKPSGMMARKAIHWAFGVKTKEEGALLDVIIQDTDPDFLKWATNQIMHWESVYSPTNCLHIHGEKDRIFPINNVVWDIKIKDGGHFMIYNRGKEISFPIRNFIF
ncbi:alpha/beta hydrolase [Sphingobacterium hotanense]|uniref:Alpha/beta hydrolase n=1 Tax=Sphingobacterium hotanense TaxID=649196 RepID=A0ABT7NLM8_9SPHI|nr:alpha/beta hydrolase [Sphingobacterium hotanense]MDM1048159.1 alpha/beta hydrolase [Sphingobacterium hotanense]